MGEQLVEWSHQHLGQWHYVLGWAIILVLHNWVIMLVVAMSLRQGLRLYQIPQRDRVCALYAWLVLGLAYEYQKHIALELVSATQFLLRPGAQLNWLYEPAKLGVQSIATALLYSASAWFLWRSWRLGALRRGQKSPQPDTIQMEQAS
jgi:hypothetical protein